MDELSRLKAEILAATDRVPPKVLNGSYQIAVTWKARALAARKIADQKRPDINKLRRAKAELEAYE